MKPQIEWRSEGLPVGSLVIADLHLDPLGGARVDHFVDWVAALEAPALLILGDLFEAWFGPKTRRLAGAQAIVEALAAMVQRGTQLHVVPGNRDFLLGRDFESWTGGRVHDHGLGVVQDGERWLFLHGDELCTLDVGYQRLKRVLRSGPMRFLGPRLPFTLLKRTARKLREASGKAVARKPVPEKSMQASAVVAQRSQHQADLLVVGHAHEWRDERPANGPRWIVLDAWEGERDTLRVLAEGAVEPFSHAELTSK